MRYLLIGVICFVAVTLFPHQTTHGYVAKTHNLRADTINTHRTIPQDAQIGSYKVLNVVATHYTAFCNTGCIGITATGYDVRHTVTTSKGRGIIAVDPRVIPLYSIVIIDGREYRALDTGGDIKGHRIDILVKSRKKALRLGRVNKEIMITSKKN